VFEIIKAKMLEEERINIVWIKLSCLFNLVCIALALFSKGALLSEERESEVIL
tara:strand:- start:515 stop:673 length:159 start_codon:yes stop_codon:yes gene_type:complete